MSWTCATFSCTTAKTAPYNLGSGQARTFYDLAASTFRALDLEPKIGFIDTPEDIRDKYQLHRGGHVQAAASATTSRLLRWKMG